MMVLRPFGSVVNYLHRSVGPSAAHEPTDRQLLASFAARDEEAFAVLVRRHGPLVQSVIRRVLGRAADADDAFQATFLVLARRAGSVRWRESIGGWLHAVAHRVARKARSRASRRPTVALPADVAAPAEETRHTSDVTTILEEELYRLPESLRTPLLLCYREGLTRDQAAQRLGCALRTLDRRLTAGRQRLHRKLTARGVSLGSALLLAALTPSAPVAAAVITDTTHAAIAFAASQATDASVSAAAVELAQSVLLAMKGTRIMVATVLACVIGILGAGAGLAWQAAATIPEQPAVGPAPATTPKAGPHHDLLGDALPAGALARMGSARLQDHGPMVYSGDGATLIAASAGSIGFWDTASGKEQRRVLVPDFVCRKLLLTPDGKTVACSGFVGREGSLLLFLDIAKGREISKVRLDQVATALAFRNGGKQLLTAESGLQGKDQTVHLRDVATGKSLWKFAGQKAVLLADGKTVASLKPLPTEVGSPLEPTLQFHEAATGKEKKSFAIKAGGLVASPDGKLLALAGWDQHEIRIWDVAAEKVVRTVPRDWFERATFTPDSKALVYHENPKTNPNETNYQLHVMDVATGKDVGRFPADFVFMGFAPKGNGMLLKTMKDRHRLSLWDWKEAKKLATFVCGGDPFQTNIWEDENAAVFSSDGRALASSSAQRIHLWDAATGKESVNVPGHFQSITHIAFDAARKTLLSAAADRTFRVWDMATGKQLSLLDVVGKPAAIAPDGKLVAGFNGDWLELFDAVTGKKTQQWAFPLPAKFGYPPQQAAAISTDGRMVAWGGPDNIIRVLDVVTKKERKVLEGHQTIQVGFARRAGVQAVAFAADGKSLVSVGADCSVRLWDLATGKEVWRRGELSPKELVNGHVTARHVVWKTDGKSVFVSIAEPEGDVQKAKVHEIDAKTGKTIQEISVGNVQTLAVSPDGKTLAYSGFHASGTYPIALVELATGKELRRFSGHRKRVTVLAFSPDGNALVSGSDDATLVVWDLKLPQGR